MHLSSSISASELDQAIRQAVHESMAAHPSDPRLDHRVQALLCTKAMRQIENFQQHIEKIKHSA